jgi:hypothetical protein
MHCQASISVVGYLQVKSVRPGSIVATLELASLQTLEAIQSRGSFLVVYDGVQYNAQVFEPAVTYVTVFLCSYHNPLHTDTCIHPPTRTNTPTYLEQTTNATAAPSALAEDVTHDS